MIDPRAVFFGVCLDQAITLAVPYLAPRIQLEMLAAAGATSTMLGGYVAGWIAARSEALQGVAVGALALAIGLLSGVAAKADLPSWYLTLVFAAAVPAGALGGLLARKKKTI